MKHDSPFVIAPVVFGALAIILSGPADAGPWYHVEAGAAGVPPNALQEGEVPPAVIAGSANTPYGWFSWQASAGVGTMVARVSNAKYTDLFASDRHARSSIRFDDLVFTDGTGFSKPVNYYVNLDVAAEAGFEEGGGDANVSCNVNGTLRVNTGVVHLWCPLGTAFTCSYPSSGVFAGMDDPSFSGTFLIGPFAAVTEVPQTVNITIQMEVISHVAWPAGNWIRGDGEMIAALAGSVPAIVVPDGFHANSTQAAVVDGWFTSSPVAIRDGESRPASLPALRNQPNPFQGTTDIVFSIDREGPSRVRVFDVVGRLVADLGSSVRGIGVHRVAWDGRDSSGRIVPAGTYFCRLEHPGGAQTKRMTLLR